MTAAGPSWTSLITTPPLDKSRLLRCSAVRSATDPQAVAAALGARSAHRGDFLVVVRRLPTAMLEDLRWPATSRLILSPGFMLPTRCGRSADSLIDWPFRLRDHIAHLQATLGRRAGLPTSCATSAPDGLSRPKDWRDPVHFLDPRPASRD